MVYLYRKMKLNKVFFEHRGDRDRGYRGGGDRGDHRGGYRDNGGGHRGAVQ